VGGDEYNQKLSEKPRFGAVRDYLVQQGIAGQTPTRFSRGLGKDATRRLPMTLQKDRPGQPGAF